MIYVSEIGGRKFAPGQTLSIFGGFFDQRTGVLFGDEIGTIESVSEDVVTAVVPWKKDEYEVKVTHAGDVVATLGKISVVELKQTPAFNLAKNYSDEDFENFVQGLFPRGDALDTSAGSFFSKLIKSIAFSVGYVWFTIRSLIKALDPTRTENLEDWERALDLPEKGIPTESEEKRRSEIYRVECGRPIVTKADIEHLLSLMEIDAEVYEYTYNPEKFAGFDFGDDDPRFYMKVIFHVTGENYTYFDCQSECDDDLWSYAQQIEEAVLLKRKQSHTKIIFGYDDGSRTGCLVTSDGLFIVDDQGRRLTYETKLW